MITSEDHPCGAQDPYRGLGLAAVFGSVFFGFAVLL